MNTKEAILWEGKKINTNTGEVEMYIKEHCFVAMETYAEQEVKLFSEWASNAGYRYDINGWFDIDAMEYEVIPFEELYELYKKDTKCE